MAEFDRESWAKRTYAQTRAAQEQESLYQQIRIATQGATRNDVQKAMKHMGWTLETLKRFVLQTGHLPEKKEAIPLKLQLEPTPEGHNPYTIEVWDKEGVTWFLSLDVDIVSKDKPYEGRLVEKITSWIVQACNSYNEKEEA